MSDEQVREMEEIHMKLEKLAFSQNGQAQYTYGKDLLSSLRY
jgi:hypothetical protein